MEHDLKEIPTERSAPTSIYLERYYFNKNSQISQQLSIVMFNHIVTLSNVIAIIVLIEEKIFENAEEKTDGAIQCFTHLRGTQHTHSHSHCF